MPLDRGRLRIRVKSILAGRMNRLFDQNELPTGAKCPALPTIPIGVPSIQFSELIKYPKSSARLLELHFTWAVQLK